MHLSYILSLVLTTTSVLALPACKPKNNTTMPLTTTQLLALAPSTSTCTTGPGAKFPDECRNATQAIPAINLALTNYNITAPAAKAALVALMLFESGNFVYNKNHFPGVPGQGTRNMQSPKFNDMYARQLFGNATVEGKSPEQVLGLVMGDRESFGSAAWFLTSQCGQGTYEGLARGDAKGWEGYLVDCIGTTVTEERNAGWKKAMGVIAGVSV